MSLGGSPAIFDLKNQRPGGGSNSPPKPSKIKSQVEFKKTEFTPTSAGTEESKINEDRESYFKRLRDQILTTSEKVAVDPWKSPAKSYSNSQIGATSSSSSVVKTNNFLHKNNEDTKSAVSTSRIRFKLVRK